MNVSISSANTLWEGELDVIPRTGETIHLADIPDIAHRNLELEAEGACIEDGWFVVKEIFWHWIAYNTEYSQRTGNATLKEALKNH